MNNQAMLAAVLLIPLLGAILNGFFLRRVPRLVTVTVGTLAIAVPFVISCFLVFGPISAGEVLRTELFTWLSVPYNGGYLEVPFALSLDRLSGILLLIITGVGSLIHLYAGEYMSHEEGVYRFFAYLNLFVFSMLSLVLGANMLVTFLGWEGVGVCSYLLIGYWYSEEANARAGMKAFVANRVGDLGFLLAMFMSVKLFGSIDYSAIAASLTSELASQNAGMITAIGLCLLLGVTGKSAQLPLYIWLPDAMAGPTPVSALIHAATMVTSGIYLMSRMSFMLVYSPTAMTTIAVVGAATALFAATIGLVQNDIKKVLAYSTVSQLGFMVLGCGVGAFQFGVAHLMTHAFFKALLFLGAGSVIHAMHHEQDIRKMGGLIKKMPVTGWTFVIGTLAIIGFPGFSGFFSKDEILYYAWSGSFGHPMLWAVGALAAACTSFYMVRLTYLVFFGESRVEHAHAHDDHHHAHEIHENPWPMTAPLVILAVLSIVGGYISMPHSIMHLLGIHADENLITQWLYPVIESAKQVMIETQGEAHGSAALEWGLMGTSTAIMVIMSLFAITLYKSGPKGGDSIAQSVGGLYRLILDKWRIDELYQAMIYEPLKKVGDVFFKVGDRAIIEGIINEGPRGIYLVTSVLSDIQSGLVRNYLKLVFVAMIALGAWIFI